MTPTRFRRIALALEGVTEGAHMGHADFRVSGRVFASLDGDEAWASAHVPVEEQARFVDEHPGLVVPASGAWGLRGWTKLLLEQVNEETVGEALTAAWRQAQTLAPAKKRAAATSRKAAAPKGASSRGAGAGARDVDRYIAAAPAPVREILEKIRATVRKLAPQAEEVISYRMPAFKQDGMLIYYAPFKAHIGIFPPVKGDAALEAALKPYRGPKGNLKFPLDGKIPYALIGRVVKARLADQKARALARRRR